MFKTTMFKEQNLDEHTSIRRSISRKEMQLSIHNLPNKDCQINKIDILSFSPLFVKEGQHTHGFGTRSGVELGLA